MVLGFAQRDGHGAICTPRLDQPRPLAPSLRASRTEAGAKWPGCRWEVRLGLLQAVRNCSFRVDATGTHPTYVNYKQAEMIP